MCPKKAWKPKTLHQHTILGQQGVNLIEKILLDMGFVWTPTGNLETGIDGIIEIRDQVTGQTTNSIIQVQSKATRIAFDAETNTGFDYLCRPADLDYWMRGNAPVVLVCSRPGRNEAYWISIKDYFADSEKRRTRKIHFDKYENKFDISCSIALQNLAVSKDVGIYFSPKAKHETIYSNLLKASFPARLYIAQTEHRYPNQIWSEMSRLATNVGSDWLLGYKSIMAFHNLEEHPWNVVCDGGTVESFDAQDWANSDDPDRKRAFVQLANLCLKEKCYQLQLKYSERCESYYFIATKDLSPRRIGYPSFKEETSRQVFRAYHKKGDPSKLNYYRHSAFQPQFLRHDSEWYLEITPTYYFTWDGFHLDEFYEEKLKKIKMLERNLAVAGQVLMWVDYLSRKSDLYTTEYPFLTFEKHMIFDIDCGIPDEQWLPNEDEETQRNLRALEPKLFE